MVRRPFVLFALAGLIACGDNLGSVGGLEPGADAAPEGSATIVRVLPWPGGGVQVAVELAAGGEGDLPEVWIEDHDGRRVDAAVEAAAPGAGLTALLVVPAADERDQAERLAAAAALLDALPDGERVAVLVARDQPVLVAELSGDRAHARRQIAALPPEPARSAGPLLDRLRVDVADLESRYTSLARTVVVVGEVVDETPAAVPRPVQTLSLLPGDSTAALVGELLARRAAIVRVGACPDLGEGELFTLRVADSSALLSGPEPMTHLAAEECRRRAAAGDQFPFPEEIELTFTVAERAIFDDRVATLSEEPFRTSVTLGAGAAIPADAHLRGASSLNCQRKNFSVTLDGPRRRLLSDLATDRFFLISMCRDVRYFGQVFGDRLLAGMGLFPPRMRYVRLRIDGVNQGVYLLLHQPERALRDPSLGTTSVVRRRYDIDLEPAEVKYPSDPVEAEQARLRFEALGDLALAEPPATLEAALDSRLELDSYLRMLALYSLLENGDYIDEAFFASSLETGGERYRVMGWDTDDLFSPCHGGGGRGIEDECGVAYCAEAELDHALLRSPAVYARYLEQLSAVISDLSAEELAATMNAVKKDLFAAITDDETAAALIEMVSENPDAATVAGARADIAAHMAEVLAHIETRRAALQGSLADCPAAAAPRF